MWNNNIDTEFIKEVKPLLPDGKLDAFLTACQRPLKKSITIAPHKMDVETFIDTTKKWGWKLTPHEFIDDSASFYIDREDTSTALGNTFLHQCGFFYIQEIAASIPVQLFDLKAGDKVLDMAASPGGKAFQLAQALLTKNDPGVVIANDVNGRRIPALAHNLNRCGCYNTAITQFNWFSFGANLPNFFDHVLVDAPCSGEGTGYKSDFAMKHRHQAEVNKIAGTQFQLLVSAIKTVKTGGTVIYSTCTINSHENEGVLAKVHNFFGDDISIQPVQIDNASPGGVYKKDDLSFENQDKVARFWPHIQETGGFFVAKIKKESPTHPREDNKHKLMPKNQFKLESSRWLQNRVSNWLKEYFGMEINRDRHFFVATKTYVYLTSPAVKEMLPDLHLEKVWIPVLKIDRDRYRPTHYLGNILGDRATKNTINLTDEQMQQYTDNEQITLDQLGITHDPNSFPYKIILRNNYGMGVTKVVDNALKWRMFK